jgi:cysteinyl-tRNA synthetase
MSDDFSTAKTLATLFELSSKINGLYHGQINEDQLSQQVYDRMENTFRSFTAEVLGLKAAEKKEDSKTDQLVELLIDMRARARARKDFDTSDKIRDRLAEIGIQLKDDKSGKTTYKIKT